MRLLIITQTVNQSDPVLGFMQRWIAEFALQCEQTTVLCLNKGAYDLHKTVRVFSMGKERRISRFLYLYNFFKIIIQERSAYDAVFVHMNQIYVVLGGIIWRLLGKKICLWYAHGHVPFSLRLAEKFVNRIFTSTNSGCRLASKKIRVIGQGIDTKYFVPGIKREQSDVFHIVVVGRISPVKDYETLLRAAAQLKMAVSRMQVTIVGGVGTLEQAEYVIKLNRLVSELGIGPLIQFIGPCVHQETMRWFQRADVFVNTSHTGSLDKAILEAMACGVPVLTCNEAGRSILGEHDATLLFEKKNVGQLVERLIALYRIGPIERDRIGEHLRNIVVRDHGIESFVQKILTTYRDL